MKRLSILSVTMLTAYLLAAQANIISTSFYSQALDETKMVNVFLPPGYDAPPDLHYPVIYFLHGWQGDQNSGNTVMNTAYTMINQGLIEPVIIVCAHNSPAPFGGSVYTNSILWGDYETYMTEDLCNWVESTYRAMPGKQYRAVFGMSMGGYGAFRYGILHNDKYCALAACAAPVSFLEDNMRTQFRQMILQANQPGPPYTYNFATGGPFTQIYFLYYGAFVPNYNTPQTYINPAILEFPLDENGNYIDTILAKVIPHDIASLINQLTPESSPGIYFGCGTNDPFFLYPGNLDVTDSLNLYGIPYTFYSHGGGHIMPAEFTENAFMFLDSLLMPPVIPCSCLPQGITFTNQAQIDNFQTNYPGCTEIEGDVTIAGDDITNLNGLSVLTSIGGV
jgi:S-formylglutathione hydrolase FrmB